MRRAIDVRERIRAEYWMACGVMESHAEDIVRPALDQLRVEVGGSSVARTVTMSLGAFERRPGVSQLPVVWESREHPHLFPTMEGELRLADAGAATTEVRLVGEYMPPLGALGAIGDKVAGARVAERSLREFVHDVADRLRAELTDRVESVFWREQALPENSLHDGGRS